MFLKTEKILLPVVWLIIAGIGLWGHLTLPDVPIAVHFGMQGPDGIMPRDPGLMLMPGLALVLMLLFLWIVPAVMPKPVSPERPGIAYGATLLATFVLLATVQAVLVLMASGMALDPVRIVTIGVGLLLVVVGNYLPKTRHNYIMGIRTPWALADERVWDRTQRFAGPLFMLGGLATIVGAFFGPPQSHIGVLVVAALIPGVASYVYSYLVARRLNLT